MKRKGFTETQIVNIWKEAEAGVSVDEIGRKHGFRNQVCGVCRSRIINF